MTELKQSKRMALSSDYIRTSLQNLYGNTITGADIRAWCNLNDANYQTVTKKLDQFKVGRGKWNLEVTQQKVEEIERTGKTFSVEQACAQLKRELIRVNITIETDEDDLIGGFRLVNGNTAWHNGPVIEALERGAILLLDEIDLASNKILCLQSILEGKGVFLKKIGRWVKPSAGFNVIATANTKGKGSDDGRFIGTNVLNEAFLERFPVTFEQSYPAPATEQKILEGIALDLGVEERDFCKRLVDWADIIRKTFYDGGIEEIISTRRLVHIIRAYSIFQDKAKAIQVCVNRFDDETKQAFLELYDKVDADFKMPEGEYVTYDLDQLPQS